MKFKVEQDDLLLKIIEKKAGYETTNGARKLIKGGNVLVDGKQEFIPSTIVKTGQSITVSFSKNKHIKQSKKKFPFHVLFEDTYFMAFIKPAGYPMITDNRKMRSIASELRFWQDANEMNEDFFIINKIDKRESGILLAARSFDIKKKFEPIEDKIKMRYYALVEGQVEQEDLTLSHKLTRNKIGLLFQDRTGQGKLHSVLKVRRMKKSPFVSLLKVEPENHVKNQIRAQLSIVGHPVIGDKKYKAKTNPLKRLGVHLFSLEFFHGEKEEWIKVSTPVPKDFLALSKVKAKKAK